MLTTAFIWKGFRFQVTFELAIFLSLASFIITLIPSILELRTCGLLHNELKENLLLLFPQPRKAEPEPSQGSFLTLPLLVLLILLAVNHNKVLLNFECTNWVYGVFRVSSCPTEWFRSISGYSISSTSTSTPTRCVCWPTASSDGGPFQEQEETKRNTTKITKLWDLGIFTIRCF